MSLPVQMQTKAMGDIHHYAWRARHRNETVYLNEWDEARYGHWTEDLCNVSSSALSLLHIVVPTQYDCNTFQSPMRGLQRSHVT